MILMSVCVYLALGTIFYLRLTATATDMAAPPRPAKVPNWHRASRLTEAVMRRVRSRMPRR